jgi:prophage regulatory protein
MAPNENCNSENQSVLRLRDVTRRVGLQRASIYRGIAKGTFPKPIALGIRARGWLESEINAWIASRTVATRPTQE